MRKETLFRISRALVASALLASGVGNGDAGSTSTLFVPIVLSSSGGGGAYFTSELTLTNRGTTSATVELRYTGSISSGAGTCTETLLAGEQRIIPDSIAYLASKGVYFESSGNRGGTLQVRFEGLSAADAAAVTVRTTTATREPLPAGAAGLAYSGTPAANALKGRATIYGLRSTKDDRSNVAICNPTGSAVTVRVTAFAGDGSGASAVKENSLAIGAYGWSQVNGVLDGTGFTSGWVTVERTGGGGAFETYGVVNCNTTSDGSFVPRTSGGVSGKRLVVPVLVETTSGFVSELVLANRSGRPVDLTLGYVESLATAGGRGSAQLRLRPREQLILPDAIDFLRGLGIPVGPKGAASYAGSLRVSVEGAPLEEVFAGARTASLSPGGGQFGLFAAGIYEGQEAAAEAYLYGLRADEDNRTNVAVANAGADGSGSVTLTLQAFDADAGGAAKGTPESIELSEGAWKQFSGLLGEKGVLNGWVRITRSAGDAPWIGYAVVNDGGSPGQRTGDGAYVPMTVPQPPSQWEVSVLPGTRTYSPVLAFNRAGNPLIGHTVSGDVRLASWDPGSSTWRVATVNPTPIEHWKLPDLAVDPTDGNPSVVYGADSIQFAHWTGNAWNTEAVEVVGQFSDMPSLIYGRNGLPAISYLTRTPSPALRFAEWSGVAWEIQTVVEDTNAGMQSLAIDSSGEPAIAYSSADGTLMLARRTGSTWTTEIVETGVPGYGRFASLAFDPAGMPAIVHGVGTSGPPGTRFVWWDGEKWNAEIVAAAGWKAELVFDAAGAACVGYAEWSPDSRKLARRDSTGRWNYETVASDAHGTVTSVAIDGNGRPAMAFDYLERPPGGPNVPTLRFARLATP